MVISLTNRIDYVCQHQSSEEAYSVIQNWLDRCRSLRRLDFSLNYMIKYNINSAVSTAKTVT